jgi:hypothetical protein
MPIELHVADEKGVNALKALFEISAPEEGSH